MSYQPNSYQQTTYTQGRASVWPTPIFPQADIPALIQDPCTKAVYLNPVKGDVDAFYASCSPFPAPITASGGIVPCAITPPQINSDQGDMEIVKLMSTSTGRFSALITDNWTNRQYMNKPVANNLVFGTAQLPMNLYETMFIPSTNSLSILCTDLSGGANDIRIVAQGRRFMGGCGGQQALQTPFISRRTHPYWLTFDNGPEVTLAANAVATQFTMTVPTSADFLCWLALDDSTVTAEDAVTVQLLEGNSGTILMDRALSLRQFVAGPTLGAGANTGFMGGTARASGFPFSWTFTHLFKRGTQVVLQCFNAAGAPQTLRFALHGQLIYYGSCPSTGAPDAERMRLLSQPYMPMPAPPNWLPCAPGQGAGPGMVAQAGIQPMMPSGGSPFNFGQTGPTAAPYRTPAGEFGWARNGQGGGPPGMSPGGAIQYGRLPGT